MLDLALFQCIVMIQTGKNKGNTDLYLMQQKLFLFIIVNDLKWTIQKVIFLFWFFASDISN